MPKSSFLHFGPAYDPVPITHFQKHRLSTEQYYWLWRTLVGPHVAVNSRLVEPWKLLCNIYLEGLLIGYGLGQKQSDEPVAPTSDLPTLLGLA